MVFLDSHRDFNELSQSEYFGNNTILNAPGDIGLLCTNLDIIAEVQIV